MPDRKQSEEQSLRVLRRFWYWKLGKADKGLRRRLIGELGNAGEWQRAIP